MFYFKTIFNASYLSASDIYIAYSQQTTKTPRISMVPDYSALCQGHKSNVLGRFHQCVDERVILFLGVCSFAIFPYLPFPVCKILEDTENISISLSKHGISFK